MSAAFSGRSFFRRLKNAPSIRPRCSRAWMTPKKYFLPPAFAWTSLAMSARWLSRTTISKSSGLKASSRKSRSSRRRSPSSAAIALAPAVLRSGESELIDWLNLSAVSADLPDREHRAESNRTGSAESTPSSPQHPSSAWPQWMYLNRRSAGIKDRARSVRCRSGGPARLRPIRPMSGWKA